MVKTYEYVNVTKDRSSQSGNSPSPNQPMIADEFVVERPRCVLRSVVDRRLSCKKLLSMVK